MRKRRIAVSIGCRFHARRRVFSNCGTLFSRYVTLAHPEEIRNPPRGATASFLSSRLRFRFATDRRRGLQREDVSLSDSPSSLTLSPLGDRYDFPPRFSSLSKNLLLYDGIPWPGDNDARCNWMPVKRRNYLKYRAKCEFTDSRLGWYITVIECHYWIFAIIDNNIEKIQLC